MRVRFDPEADALYFRLNESPIVESEEVHPGVVLDFDADDQVVGFEVVKVTGRVPAAHPRRIRFEVD